MPLPYGVTEPINIRAADFNPDHIAVLDISGGRYGGHWVITAFTANADGPVGRIDTCYDLDRADLTKDENYPRLAVDTALVWLNDETKYHGWRLLMWEGLNDQYGPAEKPYFMAARAVIGSEDFVPAEGVRYADDVLFGVKGA